MDGVCEDRFPHAWVDHYQTGEELQRGRSYSTAIFGGGRIRGVSPEILPILVLLLIEMVWCVIAVQSSGKGRTWLQFRAQQEV